MKVRTQFKCSMAMTHSHINMPLRTAKQVPQPSLKPSQELFEEAIKIALQLTQCGDGQYKILDVSAQVLKTPQDFNEYLSVIMDYDIYSSMTTEEARESIIYAIATEFI